ncbi:MAG TPA: hypothetical protein VHB69_05255 [Mycobacteriales bacterium]|nr:hypothetical protein [Mycobacteriales bacterium]
MAAFVLLLVLIGLGVMSYSGLCADSRDPDYDLGRILRPAPGAAPRGQAGSGSMPATGSACRSN